MTYSSGLSIFATINNQAMANFSNGSDFVVIPQPPCRQILYQKIGNSPVEVWDLMVLIPNLLFLLFLIVKMPRACAKLRKNDSPMFTVCLTLVYLANIISVIRCVISMASAMPTYTSDRTMWLLLRFFLLATELSVIVFGFMFGHLDSKSSIRRVLFVTFAVALAYSFTQGALEFFRPDKMFHNITVDPGITYNLFGHGGMIFWFVSSMVLSLVYLTVCILPFTTLHMRFAIPTRRSFYVYCALLAVLNAAQAIGCALLYFANLPEGWCVIDVTAYLYFAGFAPLIYVTFLRSFFQCGQRATIDFSYRTQVDEAVPAASEEPESVFPYSGGSLASTSINAADGDDVLASDIVRSRPSSDGHQSLLWHWHGMVVGVPEVKQSSGFNSQMSSLNSASSPAASRAVDGI